MTNLQPSHTAFTFPGQGSQAVGMGQALAAAFPTARDTFEQANELLGYDLAKLGWNGPEEQLNQTQFTQPALFVHSIAAFRVFNEQHPDFTPAMMAGHSLGQLSALCAAGVFSFEDGLRLVAKRGELMARAGDESPGGMAALLALDIPGVEAICAAASEGDARVEVANDNCPGQVVISGDATALERAMQAAEVAGARRVVRLAVSIAAHSYLMAHVQEEFNQAVAATPMQAPQVSVVGNVAAQPMTSIEAIQQDLQAQLTSRVRWTESIEHMLAHGITTFVELGTGDVLSGLAKRISRDTQRFTLGQPDDLAALNA